MSKIFKIIPGIANIFSNCKELMIFRIYQKLFPVFTYCTITCLLYDFRVQCLSCKAEISRQELQEKLYKLNIHWNAQQHGQDAPDGDLILDDNLIKSFQMQSCEQCNGILKPKIVFFGDNVPINTKQFVTERLSEADALLIIGSSTETFSSYRIVLAAKEQKKPIALLNIGRTRSDHLVDFKISAVSGEVLPMLQCY